MAHRPWQAVLGEKRIVARLVAPTCKSILSSSTPFTVIECAATSSIENPVYVAPRRPAPPACKSPFSHSGWGRSALWHDLFEDLLKRIQAPHTHHGFAASSGPLNLPREGDNVVDQPPVDEICRANRFGDP